MQDLETSAPTARKARCSPSSEGARRQAIASIFLAFRQASRLSQEEEAAQLKIYSAALSDLPADKLETAVMGLIQTSQWLPTVLEIREATIKLLPTDRGSDRRRATVLGDDAIERIVLESTEGQRALALGLGGSLVETAKRDLGKGLTRERLGAWLAGLGEGWFRRSSMHRAERLGLVRDIRAKEEDGVTLSPHDLQVISLSETFDRREAELMEKYGNAGE